MRYDVGRWGDYANAVAGKVGAVLFAGYVVGVEGEGKNVETECCAKSVNAIIDEEPGGGAEKVEGTVINDPSSATWVRCSAVTDASAWSLVCALKSALQIGNGTMPLGCNYTVPFFPEVF